MIQVCTIERTVFFTLGKSWISSHSNISLLKEFEDRVEEHSIFTIFSCIEEFSGRHRINSTDASYEPEIITNYNDVSQIKVYWQCLHQISTVDEYT